MLSISKEPKNIPISISILHDQEYKNLCNLYKLSFKGNKVNKRRAFSEKSDDKEEKMIFSVDRPQSYSQINMSRLKN
jgi:hypothetical protein